MQDLRFSSRHFDFAFIPETNEVYITYNMAIFPFVEDT